MSADVNLEVELDRLTASAGIAIPQERRSAVLASFADIRRQIDLVNSLTTDAEPSNVFRPMHPADVKRSP